MRLSTPLHVIFVLVLAALAACARNGSPARGNAMTLDVQHGKAIFTQQCAACHGSGGAGGPIGPPLRGESLHHSLRQVQAIVEDPQPPMPKLYPAEIDMRDVRDVSAYVESLR